MQFTNLRVVALGEPHVVQGTKHTTWICIDRAGRLRPNVPAAGLIRGDSRGLIAPSGTGHTTKFGYRILNRQGKQVKEHREVMAQVLGRPLRSDETVHHGPKGRACNDPDNLSIRLRGNHPRGHSVEELADWLRSLGCRVDIPSKLGNQRSSYVK